MQLILRVLPEKDSAYARIWLITKDGSALSGAAHGVIFKDRADWIAEQFKAAGFTVQANGESEPCPDTAAQVEKQGSLFDEV